MVGTSVKDSGYVLDLLLQCVYADCFKLYIYCSHSLKLCTWFGYDTQMIFVAFLLFKLSHFSHVSTIKKDTLRL